MLPDLIHAVVCSDHVRLLRPLGNYGGGPRRAREETDLLTPPPFAPLRLRSQAIIPCSQNKDCIRSEENPMGVRMQNL